MRYQTLLQRRVLFLVFLLAWGGGVIQTTVQGAPRARDLGVPFTGTPAIGDRIQWPRRSSGPHHDY